MKLTPLYIDEFDYKLPDKRIAKYPLEQRDASKLLIYRQGQISQSQFSQIADFLPQNSLLVFNNTRVIHARIAFHRATGSRIEVFCLEPVHPADYAQSLGSTQVCVWKCMVGNLKKWKEEFLSKQIDINGEKIDLWAKILKKEDNTCHVEFSWNHASSSFAQILESGGELPIPPYLHRKTEERDIETYQTVYSKIEGSVAAPTAGLHFTPAVIDKLMASNFHSTELTLHVGAGTFQPVKSADVIHHTMHQEVFSITRSTIELLIQHQGNIIAVGTTSVRTLESLYHLGIKIISQPDILPENLMLHQWEAYEHTLQVSGEEALKAILKYLDRHHTDVLQTQTKILIRPGYQFYLVNGIITNFHQPKSTLLLLISAFVEGKWKEIYDYALDNDFRFLSYGDSSLLLH